MGASWTERPSHGLERPFVSLGLPDPWKYFLKLTGHFLTSADVREGFSLDSSEFVETLPSLEPLSVSFPLFCIFGSSFWFIFWELMAPGSSLLFPVPIIRSVHYGPRASCAREPLGEGGSEPRFEPCLVPVPTKSGRRGRGRWWERTE